MNHSLNSPGLPWEWRRFRSPLPSGSERLLKTSGRPIDAAVRARQIRNAAKRQTQARQRTRDVTHCSAELLTTPKSASPGRFFAHT